ncbi:hypothetical protein I41_14300 [Lacipirellula limnantheis]|uniref:Uncharacterized protein n=1 Tax=Lacipirellula limnantheis TaxID=2528024 RepID=A0A517TV74_9BACT|nr:hypothetical protein I41_14300 [Lacipirellula limnantheis]
MHQRLFGGGIKLSGRSDLEAPVRGVPFPALQTLSPLAGLWELTRRGTRGIPLATCLRSFGAGSRVQYPARVSNSRRFAFRHFVRVIGFAGDFRGRRRFAGSDDHLLQQLATMAAERDEGDDYRDC